MPKVNRIDTLEKTLDVIARTSDQNTVNLMTCIKRNENRCKILESTLEHLCEKVLTDKQRKAVYKFNKEQSKALGVF